MLIALSRYLESIKDGLRLDTSEEAEIINELEPTRRGLYAGAVGYFGFSGNMDFCIAIRTLIVRGGRIYLQVGAGIVADSVPAREYEETVNKGKALVKALEMANSGLV